MMKGVDAIHTVACVGAGTIGFSWAALFAQKGLRVQLYDTAAPALDKAQAEIATVYQTFVQAGLMNVAEIPAALERIETTTDLAQAVQLADYVQESGPERYRIKRQLYRELDALVAADIVLASSSSSMLISEIQKVVTHPERCVAAHPFNPPHIVPLVEISPGEASSAEALEVARALMAKVGKTPVVASKEVRGYIVNRLQHALLQEAIWLVGNGVASAADVDLAFRSGPGLRLALMGPFLISALSGPGGLEEALLDRKFKVEEDIPSRVEAESLPNTPENQRIWAQTCVDDMAPVLAGQNMDELRQWRDAKLLQILAVLAPP